MKAYEWFQVFLASTHKDPTLQGGKIEFIGAESDLQYDIHLDPPATPISTFLSEIRLLKNLYDIFLLYRATSYPSTKSFTRYVH